VNENNANATTRANSMPFCGKTRKLTSCENRGNIISAPPLPEDALEEEPLLLLLLLSANMDSSICSSFFFVLICFDVCCGGYTKKQISVLKTKKNTRARKKAKNKRWVVLTAYIIHTRTHIERFLWQNQTQREPFRTLSLARLRRRRAMRRIPLLLIIIKCL